jgi:hypothetical protein
MVREDSSSGKVVTGLVASIRDGDEEVIWMVDVLKTGLKLWEELIVKDVKGDCDSHGFYGKKII